MHLDMDRVVTSGNPDDVIVSTLTKFDSHSRHNISHCPMTISTQIHIHTHVHIYILILYRDVPFNHTIVRLSQSVLSLS